jgi:hypothetical protein
MYSHKTSQHVQHTRLCLSSRPLSVVMLTICICSTRWLALVPLAVARRHVDYLHLQHPVGRVVLSFIPCSMYWDGERRRAGHSHGPRRIRIPERTVNPKERVAVASGWTAPGIGVGASALVGSAGRGPPGSLWTWSRSLCGGYDRACNSVARCKPAWATFFVSYVVPASTEQHRRKQYSGPAYLQQHQL